MWVTISRPVDIRRVGARCGRAAALLLCGGLGLWPCRVQAAEPPPTAAAPLAPEALMQRIDAAQHGLRTLSADFVQHSRVKLFKQQISSQGRFLYERGSPSKLRWEYMAPDASTLLLIGDRATLRIGTRAPQVFDTARDPLVSALFTQLQLWLGNGSLASAQGDYVVQSGGTAAQPALILLPRPGSPLSRAFTRIELHVDGRTMQLVRLLLVENSGDEKEILFSHLQRNTSIPQTAFDALGASTGK
jgi:outer membrane lipoprotein-sorting protein